MADRLPADLIPNILSRLPAKSLARFKCVSKPWLSLIKNPDFIKLCCDQAIKSSNFNLLLRHSHTHLSSISHNSFHEAKRINYPHKASRYEVQIIGSCRGLLCIQPDPEVLVVWNPITNEFLKLPESPYETPSSGGPFCIVSPYYGFGYDDTTKDYKVVEVVHYGGINLFCSLVRVFTLGSDSWRRLEDGPYCINYERLPGVLVNGGLHWRGRETESGTSTLIVLFDLSEEKFKVVPQPDYEDDYFLKNVGVLGGCLCALGKLKEVEINVWVMMEYGVKESWTKLFSFSEAIVHAPLKYVMPLCYCEDGRVLLMINYKELVLYDLKSGKVETLKVRGLPEWFEPVMYVQTVVSLGTGTYVERKKVSKIKSKSKIWLDISAESEIVWIQPKEDVGYDE